MKRIGISLIWASLIMLGICFNRWIEPKPIGGCFSYTGVCPETYPW
jgi:hypothetical protein